MITSRAIGIAPSAISAATRARLYGVDSQEACRSCGRRSLAFLDGRCRACFDQNLEARRRLWASVLGRSTRTTIRGAAGPPASRRPDPATSLIPTAEGFRLGMQFRADPWAAAAALDIPILWGDEGRMTQRGIDGLSLAPGDGRGMIWLSPRLASAPSQRDEVLAHEIGHVRCRDWGEPQCDTFAREFMAVGKLLDRTRGR